MFQGRWGAEASGVAGNRFDSKAIRVAHQDAAASARSGGGLDRDPFGFGQGFELFGAADADGHTDKAGRAFDGFVQKRRIAGPTHAQHLVADIRSRAQTEVF
jgi:hypothetical protein